jgi:long-chain-acyl-CoA dehydrogenase
MTATADLWQRRSLFDDNHQAFRASVREFLTRRVAGLRVAMIEEMARVPAASLAAGFATHTDIVLPHLFDFATPELGKRWLPNPQDITTTSTRDGDAWALNGAKTFITNGINADLVVVVARTVFGGTTEIMKAIIARSVLGVR